MGNSKIFSTVALILLLVNTLQETNLLLRGGGEVRTVFFVMAHCQTGTDKLQLFPTEDEGEHYPTCPSCVHGKNCSGCSVMLLDYWKFS